jgi:hypothetical protein
VDADRRKKALPKSEGLAANDPWRGGAKSGFRNAQLVSHISFALNSLLVCVEGDAIFVGATMHYVGIFARNDGSPLFFRDLVAKVG